MVAVITRPDRIRCAGSEGLGETCCYGRAGWRSCRGVRGKGVGGKKIWMPYLRHFYLAEYVVIIEN